MGHTLTKSQWRQIEKEKEIHSTGHYPAADETAKDVKVKVRKEELSFLAATCQDISI